MFLKTRALYPHDQFDQSPDARIGVCTAPHVGHGRGTGGGGSSGACAAQGRGGGGVCRARPQSQAAAFPSQSAAAAAAAGRWGCADAARQGGGAVEARRSAVRQPQGAAGTDGLGDCSIQHRTLARCPPETGVWARACRVAPLKRLTRAFRGSNSKGKAKRRLKREQLGKLGAKVRSLEGGHPAWLALSHPRMRLSRFPKRHACPSPSWLASARPEKPAQRRRQSWCVIAPAAPMFPMLCLLTLQYGVVHQMRAMGLGDDIAKKSKTNAQAAPIGGRVGWPARPRYAVVVVCWLWWTQPGFSPLCAGDAMGGPLLHRGQTVSWGCASRGSTKVTPRATARQQRKEQQGQGGERETLSIRKEHERKGRRRCVRKARHAENRRRLRRGGAPP